MARMAAREGIEVEDKDLQAIVRHERDKMALGEPGPHELIEQEEADDEQDQGR